MDLSLPPLLGATPPALLPLTLDVQWLLVDLLVAGAALYVAWSLWRSWRGKAGCASRCHSCSATVEPPESPPSSTRFPLKQL
ncbi:MAG: FeoB-associated Cys-rich membrane protein [Thermogemmata sp.]|uniref:FeoB-associated Cys-rich membrane protein n=1 Tax=Thermogemmata fonticola TaxID=2755323 RepID=A0A7V8VBV1_9BACT|nr:FeoB-associated Cys-rich membrane protein [Thermogemmata fonticola]MBA2225170.1 FeoB-associated Cys-rich membrane protein [Thermogemmata fonticola]MCX8140907.1 FeoB-associated Cys-rich membrane protein [Gemmataceae bacterium]GIW84369.1 MAG: hypothetical protein KatS3mg107_0029 [Gemmataceae bacterium]